MKCATCGKNVSEAGPLFSEQLGDVLFCRKHLTFYVSPTINDFIEQVILARKEEMKSAAKDLHVSKGIVTIRSLLEGPPIHGHGELEGSRRVLFHRVGVRFFYDLALSLRLNKTDFDIRNYHMGPDTSGEIWLHTTRILLQLSQDFILKNPNAGPIKARRCFGVRDYPKDEARVTWAPMSVVESTGAAQNWVLDYMASRDE